MPIRAHSRTRERGLARARISLTLPPATAATGLGQRPSDLLNVTLANVLCTIQDSTTTQIVCVSGAAEVPVRPCHRVRGPPQAGTPRPTA